MYSFGGYFNPTCGSAITYCSNGVRHHKPPFMTIWDSFPEAKMVTGEFVDIDTGIVTDKFYGSCNDFDLWFLGKAHRAERFDLLITDTETNEKAAMDEVCVYIGFDDNIRHEKVWFVHFDDGRWGLKN